MSRFLAVHTLPLNKEQFQGMAEKALKSIKPGFSWNQTYCDYTNHKFYCEWEAPSKEALEQVFKNFNILFDAINQVEVYNTVTKTFDT
jgi:hypothetical protein